MCFILEKYARVDHVLVKMCFLVMQLVEIVLQAQAVTNPLHRMAVEPCPLGPYIILLHQRFFAISYIKTIK